MCKHDYRYINDYLFTLDSDYIQWRSKYHCTKCLDIKWRESSPVINQHGGGESHRSDTSSFGGMG